MGTHPIFESDFDCLTDRDMKLLALFMPFYASAHQLMLTFNCVGLPGQGRTVQNVPDDCANAHFLTAPITASHLAKLSATAAAVDSTNYGLQYLSAGDGAEPESINDLAQLDAKLAKLIMAGEKVVLLGNRVQIEPRVAVSEQDHDEINRKPLAVDGAAGGDWFSFPEKAFPDCGLIKLDPNLKVGATAYKIDTDTAKWSCSKASGYASFTLPTETGKSLTIGFTKSDEIGSYKEYLVMQATFDNNTFGAMSDPLPFDGLGTFSYTCNMVEGKKDSNTIQLGNYQIQADGAQFKNGQFGMAIDCTPLFGEMVWVTLIGFLLLTFLMAAALAAVLAIESPTKFETPRSKPLIIPEHQ